MAVSELLNPLRPGVYWYVVQSSGVTACAGLPVFKKPTVSTEPNRMIINTRARPGCRRFLYISCFYLSTSVPIEPSIVRRGLVIGDVKVKMRLRSTGNG